MRNLSITTSAFAKELEVLFKKPLEKILILAEGKEAYIPTQTINLTKLEGFRWAINYDDPFVLRILSIASWYIPQPELAYSLRDSIKKNLSSSTLDYQERGKILPLLETKSLMITFLVDCDESLSAETWYGNYIERIKKFFKDKRLRLIYKPDRKLPKVERYTGYCRGYKSSPQQDKKISQQVILNQSFIETWETLKSVRRQVDQKNELATQLYMLREFQKYKIIQEDLTYLTSSYQLLKDVLGLEELQVCNILEAEELHREERIQMFNFEGIEG